jgi:hypothetical protein
MSAIANITVFDGAATPVSHTLTAISVSRGEREVTAEWREMLASVPAYAQVRASMKIETLKSGVFKTELRVVVPVMEAITNQNAAGYTAAPKVAYENTLVTTGFFHPRSTVTDRRLARQLICNLLNNISTSVAAASTGPFPELVDQLVAPT